MVETSRFLFPRHISKPLVYDSQVQILKNSNEENFSKFWFGDWQSLPFWARGKKAKERRTTALVSNLDDLVEGAQAKTTKYATKYAVNVFKVIFAFNYYNKILKITLCTIKLNANCECFEIKFYTTDRLPCFGCQMFKKWPFKLARMYQTAHQNDGFNALRLCWSKLNPVCLCYDSKPAKLHRVLWAIQHLNYLLGLPNRASLRLFQERSSAVTFILSSFLTES